MNGIDASVAALILVPAVLLFVSGYLLVRQRFLGLSSEACVGIGSSLLTGSLVAFAVFILQLYLDDKRNEEVREEQFRLSVGVTRDLSGLDPPMPLAGMHLSGKVLDTAELAGEDLSRANLQEASLRGADLEGADLSGANLFKADLTGAILSRADLRNADLRFAEIDARIYAVGESVPSLKLHGADVNAATCWPEDFMVSDLTAKLRDQPEQHPVVRHGQTKDPDPAVGHACDLTISNIVDNLGQFPGRGRTVQQLADPYGLDPDRVFRLFKRERAPRARSARPVAIESEPCAGLRRVRIRQRQWLDGPTVVIIRDPRVNVSEARVVAVSGPRPKVDLRDPLRPDLEVMAFTQKSVAANARTYAVTEAVTPC
jgi:Pentapeptide repeats (8 copies)